MSVCDFFEKCILGWDFFAWFVVDLLIALLLWRTGYRALEWLKGKPMSVKVLAIIFALILLFTVGCISHDIKHQYYGEWFALPMAMAVVSFGVVLWSVVKRGKCRLGDDVSHDTLPGSYRRQRNLQLLAKVMVWIWSSGWCIYFIAIGIANQPHVGAELLLRSAVASLDLFLMDVDTNILDAIHNHQVLKGLITCASFAAVLCTAVLIMSLVLSRLMAYLHIKHIRVTDGLNHVYLFFHLNDASRLLAKDIYEKDPSSVIVFVENSLAGESEQDEDKTDGWKNIVSMLTHRRKTFADAEENERRALAIASCDICSLDVNTSDVLGHIGLETVKKLLRDLAALDNGFLHVFFLSENRDANVRSTAMLVNDTLVGSPQFPTTIHCHACRNEVNKIIEDMGLSAEQRIEVSIIDSAHLAVELLKTSVENHPVKFVHVNSLTEENPGAVSSPFTSLVVGFGETGQEAVKFLYEFGTFVDAKATVDDSFRSPFSCYVVDKDMKTLEGLFVSEIPGVSFKKSDQPDHIAPIRLYAYDFSTDDFYEKVLKPIALSLNYVVVAVGDDETNMTVAVRILRYVRKVRSNLREFRIYVRVYEKGTFMHLNEVARHYNLRMSKDGQVDETIIPFGRKEQIYTYELIVEDQFLKDGQKYYEAYRSLQIDPPSDEGTWDERHQNIVTPNGKTTKWERMSKIRRKESQDRSDALHALTKIQILEQAVGIDHAKMFALQVLGKREGHQADIQYPLLPTDAERQLMLNLAIGEHLRWNAAHEMLGYVDNADGHKCDERTKQHNCLKPWQDLDRESQNASNADYKVDYKLFDYGVVETSFKLIQQKIPVFGI